MSTTLISNGPKVKAGRFYQRLLRSIRCGDLWPEATDADFDQLRCCYSNEPIAADGYVRMAAIFRKRPGDAMTVDIGMVEPSALTKEGVVPLRIQQEGEQEKSARHSGFTLLQLVGRLRESRHGTKVPKADPRKITAARSCQITNQLIGANERARIIVEYDSSFGFVGFGLAHEAEFSQNFKNFGTLPIYFWGDGVGLLIPKQGWQYDLD